MRVDSEFAGLLLAVGFLVMGLVSMPIGTWFVLGCLLLGGVVALLLRFTSRKFTRVVLGALVLLMAVVLWWIGRPPQRPQGVSPNALHLEPKNVGFTPLKKGYWLDCWFDRDANLDRCRLTDAKGITLFEDVFVPCVAQPPFPQSELVLDARSIGSTWVQSQDKRVNVPVIYLQKFRQTLVPRSLSAEARQAGYCSD
jgi:hypothetical protein